MQSAGAAPTKALSARDEIPVMPEVQLALDDLHALPDAKWQVETLAVLKELQAQSAANPRRKIKRSRVGEDYQANVPAHPTAASSNSSPM